MCPSQTHRIHIVIGKLKPATRLHKKDSKNLMILLENSNSFTLFSRVHAMVSAYTLEKSKIFHYSPGCTQWSVRAPWRIVKYFAIE